MRRRKSSTGSGETRRFPQRISRGNQDGGCMILNLFRKSRTSDVPLSLYAATVEQARRPVFFRDLGFPDTVTGRFDCLALHVYLFSRRLVTDSHPLAASLNQEVFDHFVRDTDRALRELGVGDTSVAKRNKKLLRGFYAMVDEFGGPLDQHDSGRLTEKAAARFGPAGGETSDPADGGLDATAIAHYMIACDNHLRAQAIEAILSARLEWPQPPQREG